MSLFLNSPMGLQLCLLIRIVCSRFGVTMAMRETKSCTSLCFTAMPLTPLSYHDFDFIIYLSLSNFISLTFQRQLRSEVYLHQVDGHNNLIKIQKQNIKSFDHKRQQVSFHEQALSSMFLFFSPQNCSVLLNMFLRTRRVCSRYCDYSWVHPD